MSFSSIDEYSILLRLIYFTPYLFLLSSLAAFFAVVIKCFCFTLLWRERKFDEAKRDLALMFLFFACFLIGLSLYFWLSLLTNHPDFFSLSTGKFPHW